MNLAVIGAQWGDEGKGKIVDYLANRADLVVRYSGGANAGHTVVVGEQTFKFHLIPSGVTSPSTKVLMGIGMVIDLETLFSELDSLTEKGISWKGRVFLADRAHLVLPRYLAMDRKQDQERKRPLGTTGRGIGIAYTLKAQREGIRVIQLFDPEAWQALEGEDRQALAPYRDRLRDLVVDASLLAAENQGKNILFEGAQGALLDLDFGTYPFVSSGVSAAAGAAMGGGLGPNRIDRVVGVCKAYSTRVGNGPFPTEFTAERDGNLQETIRELGREYGVTTGRPRRCGYLDMVALRYACRNNGLDGLIVTKLDIYDDMPEIQVCTAYEIDGRAVPEFPACAETLNRAQPVLRRFPGWKESIKDCRSFDELPPAARAYIRAIEEETGVPVMIVSVGSERSATILRRDPWIPS